MKTARVGKEQLREMAAEKKGEKNVIINETKKKDNEEKLR